MRDLEIQIEEAPPSDVLPLRTAILRPHFEPGTLARFSGDDEARHFVARRGDDILGVVSYFLTDLPEEAGDDAGSPAFRIRGMAIADGARRRGVGGRLLTTSLTRMALVDPTIPSVFCNARLGAIPFYESYGFQPFGDEFHLPEIGPHRRMRRAMPTLLA